MTEVLKTDKGIQKKRSLRGRKVRAGKFVRQKRNVLSSLQKTDAKVTSLSSAFKAHAVAWGNDRSPRVIQGHACRVVLVY